jgi:cytoskeletal protein CcmA (bactofilin family)
MSKGRRAKPGRIDTLIAQHVRIQGDLEFAGGLYLDGSVAGSVSADLDSNASLAVSENGRIEGSLTAPNVELHGAVRGDIVASGHVRLGPHSRVEGNVLYGTIEIAAGAEVRGKLVPQIAPGSGMAPLAGNGVR